MTTFCRFIQFNSIDHAKAFCVVDATPEREDGAIGVLPDGTLVWEEYVDDPEGGGFFLVADESRLPKS